jgi:hypothetical protein
MKDQLGKALRDLPRHRAGEDFTKRLEARLDGASRRSHPPSRAASWALAAVLAAAAGVALLRPAAPPRAVPPPQTAATPALAANPQLRDIRLQYELLSRDLAELKGLVEEAEPVVYLGGDESLGILLPRQAAEGDHLGQTPYRRSLPTPVRVLPASNGRL